MKNREENRGAIGRSYPHNSDKGMHDVWYQLDHHSIAITALERQMQIRLGNINTRVDDLATGLETFGLRVNLNWERRKVHAKDDTRDQLVFELVNANPCG